MKELLFSFRNILNSLFYRAVMKPILFRRDPEEVHDRITKFGEFLGRSSLGRKATKSLFYYSHPMLEQDILGIKFKNPIGLAGGFDKDAKLTDILPSVGFGFMEVGSITGEPCEGNPKPRLWRLKKSKGLVVYYGLKNEGCEKIRERLKVKNFSIPLGTNIAKTNNEKTVDTEAGIDDYAKAFKQFSSTGDYFTVNISCPNTFGGQPFTDHKRLDLLLARIDEIQTKKPVFLKLSPDLSEDEVERIINVAESHRVHGFICTNLTKNRDNNRIIEKIVPTNGGLSGKIVEGLSNRLISYVYRRTKGKFVIIGCGGVSSAEDAYVKIKLGASLVQMITGMIFEGPQIVGEVNLGLVRLLSKDGFRTVSEAVGTAANKTT